jgi:integrase
VDAKLAEREAIADAAAAGGPLMEEYRDSRTGRAHTRRRRGLSNSSINKVLAAVRQVLKEAKRRRYIEFNPLDDADCFLRTETPNRSFLELAQIESLLDAARLLDQEQRRLEWRDVHAIRASSEPATALAGRYGVSDTLIRRIARGEIWTDGRRPDLARLPVVATLVLGGPRISELCLLDSPDVDLAARAIRIPRVKTDASERVVPMVAALHEILLAYRAERPSARSGAAFETRRGTRQSPDNVSGAFARSGPRTRGRAARAARRTTDRAPDAAHAAADLCLAAGGGRDIAAAGDVPARAQRPQVHDARLPAGARHGRTRPRGARARARQHR